MPRLTRRLIAATDPGASDIILRDEGTGAVPGFHVRIRKGGSKTYLLYYRTQASTERRLKIARCDEMVPERAREIARDTLENVRRGGDPAAERTAARGAPPPAPPETFKAAVEDYIKREQEGRRGNASAPEIKRVLLKGCAAWHARPINSLTAAEVRTLLETIRDGDEQQGLKPRPYLANRTFAYLRTFFAWCSEAGIDKVAGSPMSHLRRPWEGEATRERVFSDDELRALWISADALGGPGGAFLKVLILTGKRKGALAAMRWDTLDGTGLWTPAGDARRRRRNKRVHAIPLPGLAQRILQGVPRKDGNPYVFVGRRRDGHLDPGSPLADAIREQSGIRDFFFHATRHTLETRLAERRVPPHIRDLLLDHAPARGAGKGYDHHHYADEMREALEQWAGYVEALVAPEGVRVLR